MVFVSILFPIANIFFFNILPKIPTLVFKPVCSDEEYEQIAESFHTALKGFGTDENRIIKEISSITNDQRQIVKEKYLLMYGKTLEEDLKSELKGDFEDMIIALLRPRFEYEAECLRDAIKGFGTRENVIIELLCTKESEEIEKLKQTYNELFERNLEEDLENEEGGSLGRLLRSIATGLRPSHSDVDLSLAQEEAQKLYDAGEGKSGTDESEFVRILASRSFSQLKATFDEYTNICGKDIEESVKSETHGSMESAFKAIVRNVRNRPAYFARQINKCIKGIGTKEKDLIRIIVSRCEIDMGDIKREYNEIFGESLFEELKKELRGDFEDIVLALVGTD
ncbi:annexin A13 [Brachionus plicatilis]|uniref:Annexin n=1 Tax=Brachionus plicatilis TaxID=10195 RepID=A0A3M7Q7U5_BRAPC|nr:annexin A13 [Brachionus plicatilis]